LKECGPYLRLVFRNESGYFSFIIIQQILHIQTEQSIQGERANKGI